VLAGCVRHAASFALIAYASSWMKCWHTDVFCAALLNAQPMGFYAPAQIVRGAREHGGEVSRSASTPRDGTAPLSLSVRIASRSGSDCGWSCDLPRREALWAIKALRDEPLELWSAAAQREVRAVQELDEPRCRDGPMTAGGEVVEDYRHV
jgi:error-prone DNA polymerase